MIKPTNPILSLSNVPDKPYCVYGHRVRGTLFYIGSGTLSRAFVLSGSERSKAWHAYRCGCSMTVEIIDFFDTLAEARRTEYALIKALVPYANSRGVEKVKVQIVDGVQLGVKIRPTYPVSLILCEPGHIWFHSINEASKATGISPSAISNSISRRHLWVKGKTFRRVEPSEFVPEPDSNMPVPPTVSYQTTRSSGAS